VFGSIRKTDIREHVAAALFLDRDAQDDGCL
jgi:hypothetical protein